MVRHGLADYPESAATALAEKQIHVTDHAISRFKTSFQMGLEADRIRTRSHREERRAD
jgi:hypothetical protein